MDADKDLFSGIEVEDGEDYRGAEALGIKIIVLEQYRRCCIEGSKEMRRAGISNKIIKGVVVEVEIPDQREIFINSVKMMEIILAPELLQKKDNVHLKKLEEIDKSIKQLEKSYEEVRKKFEEDFLEKNRRQPEIFNREKSYTQETRMKDDMFSKLVILFQDKLILLSIKLKDLNYFDEESITGGG